MYQLSKGELPSFMGVRAATPRTEPHQHPHVPPHHWGGCGVQGRARSSLKQGPPTCRNHPSGLMPTRATAVLDPAGAPCQEQPDERSFWVLLKDLEDKDDMTDSKEHVVLLGCLSTLCDDFCTMAYGPTSQHRVLAHGSNKTSVTSPAPLRSLFLCTGATGMGELGTICLGGSWATQKAGGVGDSAVTA